MTAVEIPVEAGMPAKPARHWLRSLVRNPLAMAGFLFLVFVVVSAVFAPAVAPHPPNAQTPDLLATSSHAHLLGTDSLGRDTLSRLIYGTRVSLVVSVSVVLISLAVALPLGIVAGYRGGRFEGLVMRLSDAALSIPALILALGIVSFLGPGTGTSICALSIVIAPGFVRVVRGQTRAVCEETFVEASRSIGTRDLRIMLHRVLPSVWSPVIVQSTIYLGGVLLSEASLSFLGLGTKLPTASWGGMLQEAEANALFTNPAQVIYPGVAIVLTVLAFNSFGDGLRDATGLGLSGRKLKAERLGITTVTGEPRTKPALATSVVEPAAAPAPGEPAAAAQRPLLQIRNLGIEFLSETAAVRVVDNLNLSIRRGEVLGLVGESGSGKTVTAMSIMRLLPSPPAHIVSGSIEFDGVDILSLSRPQLRALRGRRISMIFQDPMTSLDPSFTVGYHLKEAQRNHAKAGRRAVVKRSQELLDMVGISNAARRLDSYPHEFSGGMRQRVMIAIALANNPDLLIADEPTTALDVTVQGQILDVLRDLQRDLGMALLFVTHDLGVIADICDRVAVMYAGQIVEYASVERLFEQPRHPYTEGLLAAMPRAGRGLDRLRDIPGTVPMAAAYPSGCRFHPRCGFATSACGEKPVPLEAKPEGGGVRCVRSDELTLLGTRQIAGER
ncbi:dipeptide/oligopeptide/nickel ABC transporter permease/ATP-binding protein [Dactylosporangium sp. CA-092794]|uniref:dipeptide/oligopeptide/nickel ABC transporter permease/ATP-binding protein n=1 Tax=Dactylosporangium sp. CA-092794 TaxID=3239929 RepID=UPI003D8C65BA